MLDNDVWWTKLIKFELKRRWKHSYSGRNVDIINKIRLQLPSNTNMLKMTYPNIGPIGETVQTVDFDLSKQMGKAVKYWKFTTVFFWVIWFTSNLLTETE